MAFDLSRLLGHPPHGEIESFFPPRMWSPWGRRSIVGINSHEEIMRKDISQSESEYMLLFRGTGWHKGLSSETVQTVMNQWYDWFERLVEQGRATSGHPLAYQGKIVSGKKGHTVVDGPFVESKEAIGGYFLLHVDSEEEAIEIARHCPGLEHGVQVEVRPVVEFCPSGELAIQPAVHLNG